MIVVYYGVNLSLSLPFCLSVSLLFPSFVLCLCPNPHFHFLHRSSINLFQPLPIPSASSSGLSISPRSTCSCFTSPLLFPFLVLFRPRYLSISPGLAPPSPSPSPSPSLGAIILCSRCSARRKYSLFAPLDMAKEAICALLAIFGRFFGFFFLVHMGTGSCGQAR